MTWGRRDILSVALVGEGAAFVHVAHTPRGVRCTTLAVVEQLGEATADELRRVVGNVNATRAVVSLSPGSTLVRPVTFGRASFTTGLQELERSSGDLFPLAADDVMLGYLKRAAPADADDAGGYLIAAQRSRVEPLLEQLHSALNLQSVTVLSATMAMLGLGLQDKAIAHIDEDGAMGPERHEVRFGQVAALGGEPDTRASDAKLPSALPGAHDQALAMAQAAAIALDVAAQDIVPLHGKLPSQTMRWALPVAIGGVAAAFLLAAPIMLEARHERAIERIEAQRAQIAADVVQVQQARRELEQYAALIGQARNVGIAQPSHIMEDLLAIHRAVPETAFIESIDIQPTRVTIHGAADRAGAVLAGLEAASVFVSARDVNPPVSLGPSMDNKEEFEIAAHRKASAEAEGASP